MAFSVLTNMLTNTCKAVVAAAERTAAVLELPILSHDLNEQIEQLGFFFSDTLQGLGFHICFKNWIDC